MVGEFYVWCQLLWQELKNMGQTFNNNLQDNKTLDGSGQGRHMITKCPMMSLSNATLFLKDQWNSLANSFF